jgi:chromosome segregation protein
MNFERLRLAGFKSFVDPAELRIEPGLTGVVGPNGCGKSNLLEAVRWVMGEGSAKSLRGGGMDDVIFAGTAQRPGRDFAEVMLTVSDPPPTVDCDDTLQVVRRIERGLGSAYRVNGRDVRARDVALLFADAATGAHSPALVSQGRIGAIIAAKPGERRALLEEAAGIAGLHVRRHEAELRLRATEANLTRLDDVVAAQAATAAGLRRAAKAAERYRTVSSALDEAERALVFARWWATTIAATAATDAARLAEDAVATATRAAAVAATAQAATATTLPVRRDAAAATAAAAQAVTQARRTLIAEAERIAARRGELAATAVAIDRDGAREDGLAHDAAAAGERLANEAATLAATLDAAAPAIVRAEAVTLVAERDAATAEAGLASAMEAHARAAAASHAAVAALDAATARQARAEAEANRLAAVPMPDVAALDERRAVIAAAVATAAATIAAATQAIAQAERARQRAETARTAAIVDLTAARAAAAALTAERDALLRLLATSATTTLLDQITVAPGEERAFAAAFGDDLAATLVADGVAPRDGVSAGRFWVDGSGDGPPLPDGATALRATVPPALVRRLVATGLVDGREVAALATRLLPGQRLVTHDGRLWRWDGFRDWSAGGAATAERLTARNRLAVVTAALPQSDAGVVLAQTAVAAVDAAAANTLAADRTARAQRAAAERDHDVARAALGIADAEIARAAVRAEATAAAIARLRDEAAVFAREVAAARETTAIGQGVPALAAAVVTARTANEATRATLATARAAAATIVRDHAAAAVRVTTIVTERAEWARRAAASAAHRIDLAARRAAVAADATAGADRAARILAEEADLASRAVTADAARAEAADALALAEAEAAAIDRDARAIVEALAEAREARACAAANADHATARRREIEAECGVRFATSPPNLDIAEGRDPAILADTVSRLVAAREGVGPVNLRADIELAELTASIDATTAERAELDTAIARLRGAIGALNREGRVRLLAAFTAVDGHFRDLFSTLFAGGAAHLALVESDDPLAAGLEIMAQPPGKKLQSLSLLSGGEQALTATALIFALFLTTPSPLCVLDEVDAPLDDANVERFCDLLDRMAATTTTRFLIVTHNAVTMSRMHRLYGVTMAEPGVSQLVSVDLGGAARLLAAE